jgi:hypothetical protein
MYCTSNHVTRIFLFVIGSGGVHSAVRNKLGITSQLYHKLKIAMGMTRIHNNPKLRIFQRK